MVRREATLVVFVFLFGLFTIFNVAQISQIAYAEVPPPSVPIVILDKPEYTWTDKVYITIVSPDHNFDPAEIDSIGETALDFLEISTREFNLDNYKLVETGPDTGIFTGEVILTGFDHDADGDGDYDTNPRTEGSGPTDGFLQSDDDDGITVSFTFSEDDTVVGSSLVKWNIGEIQWLESSSYSDNGTGIVRVIDPDMNLDPEFADSFEIDVWSDSDAGGIDLVVTETGESTGIFEGTVFFTTDFESHNLRLRVSEGDTITAEYEDNTLPDPYTTADERDITATALFSTTVPPFSSGTVIFSSSTSSIGIPSVFSLGEVQWSEAIYEGSNPTGIVRVIDPDMNLDPEFADSFGVVVWSESDVGGIDITVTETGEATGIFEGTVLFTFTSHSASHVLRVSSGDIVTAEYEDNTLPNFYTTIDKLDIEDTALVFTTIPPVPDPDDEVLPFTNGRVLLSSSTITDNGEIIDNAVLFPTYSWTDKVYITIVSPDHNFDPAEIDSIGETALDRVKITTRGHQLINYKLVESGADTGIFTGQVTLTGFLHDADGDGDNDTNSRTEGSGPTGGFIKSDDDDGITVSFAFSGSKTILGSSLIMWNLGEIQWLAPHYASDQTGIVRVIDPDMNLDPEFADSFEIDVWSDSDAGGIDLVVTETGESTGIFEGTVFFTTDLESFDSTLRIAEGDTVTAEYEDNTLPHPYSIADELDITATSLIGTVVHPLERAPSANLKILDAFNNPLDSVSVNQQVQIRADLANGQNKDQAFTYLTKIQDSNDATIRLAWLTGTLAPGQSFSPSLSWTPDASGQFTINAYVIDNLDHTLALSPPQNIAVGVSSTEIPAWLKNNAGWWADGLIDDDSFTEGIQYMIEEDILNVSTPVLPDDFPIHLQENARWWAVGQVPDDYFLDLLEDWIEGTLDESEIIMIKEVPSTAYLQKTTGQIALLTDKPVYNFDDVITIEGSNASPESGYVTILIKGPDNSLVEFSQEAITPDGTFSSSVIPGISLWQDAGEYTIFVRAGETQTGSATLFFTDDVINSSFTSTDDDDPPARDPAFDTLLFLTEDLVITDESLASDTSVDIGDSNMSVLDISSITSSGLPSDLEILTDSSSTILYQNTVFYLDDPLLDQYLNLLQFTPFVDTAEISIPGNLDPATVIGIGSTDTHVVLSQPARIALYDSSGKIPFYSQSGEFNQITTLCDEDNFAVVDAQLDGDECYIDNGIDIIIWTEHFTSFGTAGLSFGGNGSGCDGDCSPPTMGIDRRGIKQVDNGFSYNDNFINVEQFHTPYPLITTQTGQSNTITAKVYENRGPHNIKLVQFGLGIPEVGSPLNDAEVIVEVWLESNLSDVDTPPSVQELLIRDSANLIESDSVLADTKLTECINGSADTDGCLEVSLHYVYREAPMYNVVLAMPMDLARNSEHNYFNDGITVAGQSLNPPKTEIVALGQSGTIQVVTQIDKKGDLWVDEQGHQWTKNNHGTWIQLTKPDFQRHQDEISNVMTRDNSNFSLLVEYEKEKAMAIFDGASLQKELPDYFAYTYLNKSEDKLEGADLQEKITQESLQAEAKLVKMWNSLYPITRQISN